MNTYEKDNLKSIVQYNIYGNQVNVNNGAGVINAQQDNHMNQPVEKQIIIVNKPYSNAQNSSTTKATGDSDEGILFVAGVLVLIAAGYYVQYRSQIRLGVIVISLIIELLTYMVYRKGKKNRVSYDKNLKQIAIFNMVSVIMIPVLIGLISSPIYNSNVNFDILEQQIITKGIIQAFITLPVGQYAMFQMVGMLFIGIFLIYIMISDLYIIAVINIVMEKRGQWFWRWLLRKTCGKSKDGIEHIKTGVILLAVSFILTIGILPYFISLLEKASKV